MTITLTDRGKWKKKRNKEIPISIIPINLVPINTPGRLTPNNRLTLGAPASERQLLEGLRLAGPDGAALRLLLDLGDPEVRDDGAQQHAHAEDDQDGAVPARLDLAGRTRAEFVVVAEHLHQDRAQFAGRGADAVAGGAVAGGEELGGDDVGGAVGAEVERDLAHHVQADGERAFLVDGDEDGAQGDEERGEHEEAVFLERHAVEPARRQDPQHAADEGARVEDHQRVQACVEEGRVHAFVRVRLPRRRGTRDAQAAPGLCEELRARQPDAVEAEVQQ